MAAADDAKGRKKGGLVEEVVEFETSEDVDVTPTFDSLGLREELLRGIYAYGARAAPLLRINRAPQVSRSLLPSSSAPLSPSSRGVMLSLSTCRQRDTQCAHHDFRAQSGTGKTATFSIAALQCIDTQVRLVPTLILMGAHVF